MVASGRYKNVSEVIGDGLRLLETRAQAESAKLLALREAATQGVAAIERGEYLALESSQAIENFVHKDNNRDNHPQEFEHASR